MRSFVPCWKQARAGFTHDGAQPPSLVRKKESLSLFWSFLEGLEFAREDAHPPQETLFCASGEVVRVRSGRQTGANSTLSWLSDVEAAGIEEFFGKKGPHSAVADCWDAIQSIFPSLVISRGRRVCSRRWTLGRVLSKIFSGYSVSRRGRGCPAVQGMPNTREWYTSVAARNRGGEGELLPRKAAGGLCGAGFVPTELIAHHCSLSLFGHLSGASS